MAAEPLISVALCTYNGERHLREQLDSLFAQTYPNMEIVAVDDASTDRTVEVLREYQQRDARMRVFVNDTNVGFIRNFEIAISRANGLFIAPCDQDDIWLPNKLEVLAGAIGEHPMIYSDSELIDAEGQSLGISMSRRWPMQNLDDPAALLFYNCVSGHAMMFRRDLLDEQPALPDDIFHDWWLAVRAAARGTIVYCPEKLVRYRQHGRNVTKVLRTGPKVARPVGSRLRAFDRTQRKLDYLATLEGPQGAFFAELRDLWRQSESAWFTPRLVGFMLRHRRRLHRLLNKGCFTMLTRSLEHLFGLRLRRLVRPAQYTRALAFEE